MMRITVAGAGAGKTTNLATLIAQRYSDTDNKKNIFCITYTNNAVNRIKQKLSESFSGEIPQQIHVQTIHSFLFQEIIRPYYYLLYGKSFDRISYCSKGDNPQYYNSLFNKLEDKRILHVDAVTQRSKWVIKGKSGDKTDLKNKRDTILKTFASYCNSIYIDEAQDIDKNTSEILEVLDKLGIWIDLVGDPKQDIKGNGCLRKLAGDYPETVSYINECYRCPQEILKISNSLVNDSEKQYSNKSGGDVKIVFESQLESVSDFISSFSFDLMYILKRQDAFYTHDKTNDLSKRIAEISEKVKATIIEMHFYKHYSDLELNREAFRITETLLLNYQSGETVNQCIFAAFRKKIESEHYFAIKNELESLNTDTKEDQITVNSIESIKGCEGKDCLFILTPDLAPYLFGDKKEENKMMCSLYVALTRSLNHLTILVTKKTEEHYSEERFKDLFADITFS